MQELLQEIDLDYYRSAQLLIVRAELEQLRRESLVADVERKKTAPRAAGRVVASPRPPASSNIK